MNDLTRDDIVYAIREVAKYAAIYGIGFGVGALIPLPDMETRYAELGHIVGGASVLVRAYIDERRRE